MWILTKDLIKKSEERSVKDGTFSFKELMYTAGKAAANIILHKYEIKGKKIAVVCGKGNNGGDGCVIAGILAENGGDVEIITPFGPPSTENAAFYYESLTEIKKFPSLNSDYDIIVDAVFGIGYTPKENKDIWRLFTEINLSPAIKISVDLPSGVECDTGKISGSCVKADLTVTFIALKPCFVLPFGSDYCGETVVADIGVEPIDFAYKTVEKPKLNPRKPSSHKGTFGTALLICGSYGFAGAAMLSSKAALRSGLGIAKVMLPKSIYTPFTCYLPEAVCIPAEEKSGLLKFDQKLLDKHINSCSALLFGCGSGQGEEIDKITSYLIENCTKPMVIDADGINSIAQRIELLKKHKAPIILTPHPGEMARLMKTSVPEIEANRVYYSKKLSAEYNCIVVLKGSNTVIATPTGDISFCTLGNSGMATGGSGDVLAGVIVSLLAQGYSAEASALNGVYLHSLAGDRAAEKRSRHALLPTDIIEEL